MCVSSAVGCCKINAQFDLLGTTHIRDFNDDIIPCGLINFFFDCTTVMRLSKQLSLSPTAVIDSVCFCVCVDSFVASFALRAGKILREFKIQNETK